MKKPPLHAVYPIRDLRDLLIQVTDRYSDRVALKSKKDGAYQPLTYAQLRAHVEDLAAGLSALGLQKGDRVGVLSENRTEWCIGYLAAVAAGLVALPIDKDLTTREIGQIVKLAEPRVLFSSAAYTQKLRDRRGELPSLKHLISMEDRDDAADLVFPAVLKMGAAARAQGRRPLELARVEPDDLAAIIFTSGTTGGSKGVMLTHGNIAADVVATSQYVSIQNGTLLSVLPLHHTYECTGGFLLALYQGCTIAHAENLRRIPENLQETGATVMLGVPLLFESLYRRIENAIKEKGERKFQLAKKIAGVTERIFRLNIRRLIFKKVHQKLGGHLQLFISGGAANDPKVSKGFRELGIHLIQGYGMTESSPISAVNRVNCFKDASAGLPLPGISIRIVDSEVAVRGPIVMKGYYRNEAATRETIRDGWLYTGDLGYLDEDGFLYISGRKKSVIVTPNGKNVYPEEVEAALNQSPYIQECLVWGGPEEDPSQVEVQAIIVPQRETFDQEFGESQYDQAKIQEVISQEVKRLSKDLAQYKRIKKFVLRSEEFDKTTTRKIKRYLYTGKARPTEPAPTSSGGTTSV